jgi:hypothetical protein
MRFLRHDGIYRSDVSLLLVNPAQMPPPVGRPRCRAIARDGRSTPCPSSAMSSGRLFLDRGGRHQSPSPLHRHIQHKSLAFRRASEYHRTACSVLTVCVSRGDKRKAPHHLSKFRASSSRTPVRSCIPYSEPTQAFSLHRRRKHLASLSCYTFIDIQIYRYTGICGRSRPFPGP